MICRTQNSHPQTESTLQSFLYSAKSSDEHFTQHTCRCAYSICVCILYPCVSEGTVSTGEAEAEVETGADRGLFWGPVWDAEGRQGIGYSQNYFHMVQRPLVMSCTVVAWLPPSQHHPFNPRLSGETMGNIVRSICMSGIVVALNQPNSVYYPGLNSITF